MDISTLLQSVHTGTLPPIFKGLDYKLENEDRERIESIIQEFPKLVSIEDGTLQLVISVLDRLQALERHIKWMKHPIYLNEFKDKYDNKYIQARTSLKGADGKTKWISAYIGSINEYPNGVNDVRAMDKAKPLIRKKLKKYFEIK